MPKNSSAYKSSGRRGIMQSKTDTSCLGLHSTHRSTRLAPSTTRISLPDVLRSTRRDTSKQRGERRRSIRWCGLLRRVRCIAWRREDGKARLHHQGSERGHLHHLAPAETPEKKAGEIPTGAAMGEAITGTKVATRSSGRLPSRRPSPWSATGSRAV